MKQQQSLKIIDKIRQRIEEKKPFFSFEFFPPKTGEGVANLYVRFDRMATLGPVIYIF
jgi:methylenetetrahydrofolate reductase (NADPH)